MISMVVDPQGWESIGPRAQYRIAILLGEMADKIAEDSRHYGDDNDKALGLRGQFSDIWRKIGPLRRALWEDETLVRETPRAILMDLIGHCLLTIQMIDEEADPDLAPGGRREDLARERVSFPDPGEYWKDKEDGKLSLSEAARKVANEFEAQAARFGRNDPIIVASTDPSLVGQRAPRMPDAG